jgi:hypothetical protein
LNRRIDRHLDSTYPVDHLRSHYVVDHGMVPTYQKVGVGFLPSLLAPRVCYFNL